MLTPAITATLVGGVIVATITWTPPAIYEHDAEVVYLRSSGGVEILPLVDGALTIELDAGDSWEVAAACKRGRQTGLKTTFERIVTGPGPTSPPEVAEIGAK